MTEEEKKAAELKAQEDAAKAAAAEVEKSAGEAEAKIKALEDEKAKLTVEAANWKLAALKNKGRIKKEESDDTDDDKEETPDIRALVQEELVKARIGQVDAEKEELLKKVVKENKELRLAQANKTTIPSALGTSQEEKSKVQDTLVTQEQIAAFKKMGWSDKDIERYKKNLSRRL